VILTAGLYVLQSTCKLITRIVNSSYTRIITKRGFHCFNLHSKTVPWCSSMHKEGNELCIMYPLIYGSVL